MSAPAGAASCDLLLTNATVLTMNESLEVYPRGAVAVTGDHIVAVGDGLDQWEARERIDCGGRVVMPGFVNAHTHVPMTLVRGLADDLKLITGVVEHGLFLDLADEAIIGGEGGVQVLLP